MSPPPPRSTNKSQIPPTEVRSLQAQRSMICTRESSPVGRPRVSLPDPSVEVTPEKLKKSIVRTGPQAQPNVSISPEDIPVGIPQEIPKPSEDLLNAAPQTHNKMSNSRQATPAGNSEVSPAEPSKKTSSITSQRTHSQCQNNISYQKQGKTAAESPRSLLPDISKTTPQHMVKKSVSGSVAQAQKSTLNPNKASPCEISRSSILGTSKVVSMKTSESVVKTAVQAQQRTLNPRQAANTGIPQSSISHASKNTYPKKVPEGIVITSPRGQNGASNTSTSNKPQVNTTHPKLALSCVKKLVSSHISLSYPTLDAADLDCINHPDGTKVVLGRGNNAEVTLMRRRSDGTLLAVKRLTKNRFRTMVDKDMLREVTALRSVRRSSFFPKLVGVIDYSSFAQELIGDGSDNSANNFYMARYYLNLLRRGDWFHVCRDITAGLMELHHAGWMHNDLHSGNVMVCRNPPGSKVLWSGKIIDLGCAQNIYSLAPPLILTKEEKQQYHQAGTQVR